MTPALDGRELHVTQVSPTTYSRTSVIGGGEKYVVYVDHALKRAAGAVRLTTSVLSFGAEPGTAYSDRAVEYEIIAGRPWDAASIEADELVGCLRRADVVYVHQCLTSVGLLVAAQARLLGKRVVGMDAGGGEDRLVQHCPELARVYDAFHAVSEFALTAFRGFDVPVHLVPGPVDTDIFVPPTSPARGRRHVLAIGRIMPHKGFDRIVRALPGSLHLTVVGAPYDEPYLEHLRDLARGKEVRFESGLDDAAVRTLLQSAGLFVHASTHLDYRGQYAAKPELLGLAPLEALSSGLPTLVSNAGALPELARLPGCRCFADDAELAALLEAHAGGTLAPADPAVMHDAVASLYGPEAFGRGLLKVLGFA